MNIIDKAMCYEDFIKKHPDVPGTGTCVYYDDKSDYNLLKVVYDNKIILFNVSTQEVSYFIS